MFRGPGVSLCARIVSAGDPETTLKHRTSTHGAMGGAMSYCGWTKSCTTWKLWETCFLVLTGESSFEGVLGGAGFYPPTVGPFWEVQRFSPDSN